MAKTLTYSNNPVLSKIKFPGSENVYWLKDYDAREILNAISADVYEILQNALGTVDAGGNHLVNAANIKDYVDRIAEIGFDVVVLETLPTADAEAYEEYHNNIVLIADASSKTGAYVEYVILRKGTTGAYTYSWEKIGTTEVDLKGYVKDVVYDDATHTLKQTKTNNEGGTTTTDVHQFGNLADADTASGEYIRPVGTGTVTINQYDITGANPTTITGEGTADIEYVDGLTGSTVAGFQFNYNAIKDTNLKYGETTGKDVEIVSGISGTQAFNTNAIDDANLTYGEVTGKSVNIVSGLTGTTSYATYAISATLSSTDSECLEFKVVDNATFNVTTATLGLTTNAATTSSFTVTTATLGLTTTLADKDNFEVTTKHIHVVHTTPTANVTVDTATATVTVDPDPRNQTV